MSESSQTSNKAIDINETRDAERPVLLQPATNDLFVRTGRQVIEACQLSISVEVWLDELQNMLAQVSQWCTERSDKISFCAAVARGSKVILFFTPNGSAFNFDLADDLTDLNRQIVTGYNLGMIEVAQIPLAEIERFFDPMAAKLVYGKLPAASHPVET
jgi:hypothetical protein